MKGKEAGRMYKAANTFAVKADGGVVRAIGNSVICQPKTNYSGRKTKWYEERKKKS